ncbi:hypothetical protein A4249_01405 [Brevundimonas sp. GW460-12-10-14-LB2]|uniref:hypothetical protein n=1 Tax=Brevundimonas sp. GW460-12-10-14-LB2 TaxID=1827469 RepID=UPI0007BCAA2A|nr:hypothetical protein [Brevundimonas sp. GW460-12-10-14-LB2]ANC52456.1 hypothetical protein A4249_01405 [Brevundimonas sp. GW460-12-10-14-LB2]
MDRPWIEGVALLAAHNHPTPAPRNLYRRRYRMSHDVRFAILTANPADKPKAFPDLEALARHIQRERGLQALELVEVEDLEIDGDTHNRRAVSVFALDAGNDRDRLIGHAYLDGQGMAVLQAALRRNRLVMADDMKDAA